MKRALLAALSLAVVAAVGLAAHVRLAPSGEEWHVDPEAAGTTGPGRHLLADGGDAPALRLDMAPDAALAAFDEAARAEGAERLVWAPDEGRATYVARSQVMGFPDYVSVKAMPEAGGTRLSAYSRLRFGVDDMGVNRARMERILARLAPA